MFHISEKLTAEPVCRDAEIARISGVLMTCLKAACREIPPLPDMDEGTSIRQEIYKLSMQIKRGLPSESRAVTDDDRLEHLYDLLSVIPAGFVPPKFTSDETNNLTTPELRVFPDLESMDAFPESSVHAINLLIEKTIHLLPQTLPEHRLMSAKLHVLALLVCCIHVHRLLGYEDVFTSKYRHEMISHYQTMKRMYLW